jgi:predicted acetyltransferase
MGYDVRPAAHRKGHATAMLRAVLPRTYGLGIDPVLQ